MRQCFCFKRVPAHTPDLPTPENFIEQLLDDEGRAFNLAEVGGFFTGPDAEWVSQYRRAFAAAADKIGSDTSFIERLSYVAARLLPDDALTFSPGVLRNLLDLGVYEVISLEDWVTKRTVRHVGAGEARGSTELSGSDKRAYEDTLISFMGGWERLLQTLIFALGLERRGGSAASSDVWRVFTTSFPVLQAHLRNTAYFFAASVWNDDPLGTERFRDLLLRWLEPFHADLQSAYLFSNTLLFTPDIVDRAWPRVQAGVARYVRFPQEHIQAAPVSGMVLWELHADVVCVSGLVALHWYATDRQSSETASQGALRMLSREVQATEGSTLTDTPPKTTFRLLFDLLLRYGLSPRLAEARYSATIDALVRYLTNPASPRMVSGRVYGGFGIDGLDTLRPVLLAAMAATLPERGDDGIAALVDELKDDPLFQAYKTVRTFVWTMQQVVQFLADSESLEVYRKAARVLRSDLDLPAATARLRSIFSTAVDTFETLQKERLRTAPLDDERMALVRRRITENVLAFGPSITCFHGYSIRRREIGDLTPTVSEFGAIDKGSFVSPEMSNLSFDDLPPLFVDASRIALTDFVWRGLYQRPKRVVAVDVSDGTAAFWRRVTEEAPSVGPAPVVVVPYPDFGDDIVQASLRMPGAELMGFNVTMIPNIPTGGGTGYLGTIDGVHVYSARIMVEAAVLCSGHLIKGIEYGIVHGKDDIVDVGFIDGEDLSNCRVRLTFAQHIEWADNEVVEFMMLDRN